MTGGASLLPESDEVMAATRSVQERVPAVLRRFVLSHIVHHRAQLGVYPRLDDISVPNVYRPSADEG
jgi:hypothetical protein